MLRRCALDVERGPRSGARVLLKVPTPLRGSRRTGIFHSITLLAYPTITVIRSCLASQLSRNHGCGEIKKNKKMILIIIINNK